MSENKLITLFKQCCDNPDFEKKHGTVSTPRGEINYPLEEQPFEVGKEISEMLISGGYTVKDIGSHYTSSTYGRLFEFDGEPPLKLVKASVKLTLLMGTKYIKLGDVEEDYYIKKCEKYVDTFWGKRKKVKYEEKYKFHKRSVEITKSILEANHKIWKDNQKSDNSWGFCPRSSHRYERPNMIIVTRNYKREDSSNWWFQKDIDVMESSHFESDLHDYDKVMSGIQHDHMEVHGGLLAFGDVWVWLDWGDYQELEKYYLASIRRTHEAVLEQRLKETKKAN